MLAPRKLGKLNKTVSPIGFGCAAIGGTYTRNGKIASRGSVDDNETVRAIHAAIDCGICLFDVANIYGAGHVERVLGKALHGRRQDAILQVKFGASFDEVTKEQIDYEGELTAYMLRNSLEGSLRRLETDTIDIFQLQNAGYPAESIPAILETLDTFIQAGKIQAYSFGTPDVSKAELFAQAPHCATIITGHNVLMDAADMLTMLEEYDVALLAGVPLFLGFLSGNYDRTSTFATNDQRTNMNLKSGGLANRLAKIEQLRDCLTSNGRTMVQGALAWLWSRHHLTIPVVGFKRVEQVEEAVNALEFGPLSAEQMAEIDTILNQSL